MKTRSVFEVGDLVKIKTPTQMDYVYATDQVYTVKEFLFTGWIVLTPFPGPGNVFKDYELEFVNEDLPDWESDYYDISLPVDDYLSERDLPPTHDPKTCEECVIEKDWNQAACENITAVQKAYQEGLNASIENAYQEAIGENLNDRFKAKKADFIIPELAASCIETAAKAKFNGTLISAGITEVGTYGAIIYKKFLEELEK